MKLSGDEQRIVFGQLCNVLEPGVAVALSSVSNELREPTQPLLLQLRTDHEAAAALCRKVGMRSCKELREAKMFDWRDKHLEEVDLMTLGTLGSVLPSLEKLWLFETSGVGMGVGDGVQLLAEGLGAGALPAVALPQFVGVQVYDTGALALAAALGRGALPRLEFLNLSDAAIGDAGLVALAPALRRLPALETLSLAYNPFVDEGLTALVAPPVRPPSLYGVRAALPPPNGVLSKLNLLDLSHTQVSDAGCAALASAFDTGALLAPEFLCLDGIPASAAAQAVVQEALSDRMDFVKWIGGESADFRARMSAWFAN